jgi:hypothetical protein
MSALLLVIWRFNGLAFFQKTATDMVSKSADFGQTDACAIIGGFAL